jgi:hypothetical protein
MPHPAVTTVVLTAATFLLTGTFGCLLGRVRRHIQTRSPRPPAQLRERAVAEVIDRPPFDSGFALDPPPKESQ